MSDRTRVSLNAPRARVLFVLIGLVSLLSACGLEPGGERALDDDDDDGGELDWFPVDFDVVWTGDILLADRALPALEAEGYLYPFEHLWELSSADYLIGNLEGPITTIETPHNPNQTWSYNALPAAAGALAEFGFDAMSLANNHLMDRGPQGVADTRSYLLDEGIEPFGAGSDAEEASVPLLFTTPFGVVAVVGMSETGTYVPQAGPGSTGSHTFSPARIQDSRTKAVSAGADYVIAFVHWGNNYDTVESIQQTRAQLFADAGFDLVIGHGAHVPQEVDIIDGMVVLYSLGNFTFGTEGRFDSSYPGYGLVARTVLGLSGIESIELQCILTDNDRVHYQPAPCPQDEAEEVLSQLGPWVEVTDGVGRVSP